MKYTLTGQIPKHLYVWVDSKFVCLQPEKPFIPAVWFGLVSYPARAWGCTLLLESGAVYRNVPAHALAFREDPVAEWTERDAQTWNCYGYEWSTLEYEFLRGLPCKARCNRREHTGEYLFSVSPIGDGWSAAPDQSKEFTFIKLDNGRLSIQPTNHIIFKDTSFIVNPEFAFPTNLQRQTRIYTAE